MQTFFSTFSAALKRETLSFTLLKFIKRSFQRYVSNLFLNIVSEKRFDNNLHITLITFIIKENIKKKSKDAEKTA